MTTLTKTDEAGMAPSGASRSDVRGWVAESRAWGWRHVPTCTAMTTRNSPFDSPFVDDDRCTCYVLKLYGFETGNAPEAPNGK